ncbi:MAG: hypothetical protein R3F60_09570 [bacterium]
MLEGIERTRDQRKRAAQIEVAHVRLVQLQVVAQLQRQGAAAALGLGQHLGADVDAHDAGALAYGLGGDAAAAYGQLEADRPRLDVAVGVPGHVLGAVLELVVVVDRVLVEATGPGVQIEGLMHGGKLARKRSAGQPAPRSRCPMR